MTASEVFGEDRFCAGGEGSVGQVDESKVVLVG
jgi:hypothetical protein